jgi:3-methylfumaryl-CoA hydratase
LHLVMRKGETGYDLAAFADDGRQVTQASAAV